MKHLLRARTLMRYFPGLALLLWLSTAAHGQVSPILDYVTYNPAANTVTATWGYVNTATTPVTVVPSNQNFFTPPPSFQGQPVVFQPGLHHNVFQTTFCLGFTTTQTWFVQGIKVTASNDPALYRFEPRPTYQGLLTDGLLLANGDYDLQLQLFSNSDQTSTDPGFPLSPIEYKVIRVTNGIFTVPLNFTREEINNAPWLEIGVRPSPPRVSDKTECPPMRPPIGPYTILKPRQNLLNYAANGSFKLIGTFWDANLGCVVPAIVTQPGNQGVSAGAAATFSVVASGTGLSYQWRKNGQNINGATSASLMLNNVNTNDNGSLYDVIVTGVCGQITSDTATLTVTAPPSTPAITPVPTTVCAASTGNSASTTATNVSYKWTITNGTITSADNTSSVVYNAGSAAANSGNVTLALQVTNASGSTSNSINVPINTAPMVMSHPADMTVCVGGAVTFTASASGSPAPSVKWQVKASGASSFSDIPGAMSTTLSFTATAADHGKQYRAVFTNLCSTATSNTATLSVYAPPSISTQPVSQLAPFGSGVSFSVVAGGGGPFTYQWRKNGANIASATGSSYSIAAVGVGDVASYDAVVTGACGATATSSAVVLTLLPYSATKLDFDGDGKTELAIWRPATATFWIYNLVTSSVTTKPLGISTDVPVPGDYDGDGKADVAVWRPATATWLISNSSNGATVTLQWGSATDVPTPGDYDGDGKTDLAVWRPSNGTWMIFKSSGGTMTIQWGTAGDVPVPSDYNGDGKTDLALWRPSTGFWIYSPATNTSTTKPWGNTSDVPAPRDYDGDGKTDLAVWRPATATYLILNSSNGTTVTGQWGSATDVPTPADYDGDGKADLAIWRPTTGVWWILNSTTGSTTTSNWGVIGDVPVR